MSLTDNQMMLLEQLTAANEDLYGALGIRSGYSEVGVLDTIKNLSDSQILELNFHENEEINNLTGKEWSGIIHAIKNDKDIMSLNCVGYDSSSHAYCFEQPSGSAIVAFQGTTGASEWEDNGYGFHMSDTGCQKEALAYINGLKYDSISVVGHSKGGNKAQYVALLSDKVDHCVSMDGQGFSPEFYKEHAGQVKNNAGKINSYSAKNDFVHILLEPVPGSNQYTCTRETLGDKTGAGAHDPNGMFEINPPDYTVTCTTTGTKNKGLELAGDFTRFAVNNMPYSDRMLIGAFVGNIMAIACTGKGIPINGINYNLENIMDYVLGSKKETSILLAYLLKYIQLYGVSSEELKEMLDAFGIEDSENLSKAIWGAASVLGSEPGITYPALIALLNRTGLSLILSKYKDIIVSALSEHKKIKIGWDNTYQDSNSSQTKGSGKRITVNPELLTQQSNELSALAREFESAFNTIDALMTKSHRHLSSTIASNLYVKTSGLKRNMKMMSLLLSGGAEAAKKSATSFDSVDSELRRLISKNNERLSVSMDNETKQGFALKNYFKNVSDAEYAKLCYWWGYASEGVTPKETFLEYLCKLPPNDPLHNLTLDQVQSFILPSGLAAVSISDGQGNALVVFAGTQSGDWGDIKADAGLLFNISSSQAKEANAIIDLVSKDNQNIEVTGHSLGGYLATSATLNNSYVSRCVAFDPPGRRDVAWQNEHHPQQVAKITTYEAEGSHISGVGNAVGNKKTLQVEENGGLIDHNHGILEIRDALGGERAIAHSWNTELSDQELDDLLDAIYRPGSSGGGSSNGGGKSW